MDDHPDRRIALQRSDEKPAPSPKASPAADPNAPLEERVVAALHSVYDPEIPVDIYELGLIYDLKVDQSGAVAIRMTLTSPGCPVAGSLPGEVRSKVQSVPGVTSATVDLVWEPPWGKERMSEAAQLTLGMFD
jgi:FeS assembly SUF system protein